jgi:uncharacterized protein
MKLSSLEKHHFMNNISEFLMSQQIHDMKNYIQHGETTTYTHCFMVSYYSYLVSLRLPIKFDTRSITRGAFLHDFYLYDWHIPDKSHKLHGFVHPNFALKNAGKYFLLNSIEKDIIQSHMWPLTITKYPRCREALLVCLIDKYCSFMETLHVSILPADCQNIHKKYTI